MAKIIETVPSATTTPTSQSPPEVRRSPLVREFLASQKEALELAVAANTMGIKLGGQEQKPSQEQQMPMAAAIVTKAMDVMSETAQSRAREAEAATTAARATETQLFQERLARLADMERRVEEASLRAVSPGAAPNAFDQYRAVRAELEKEKAEFSKAYNGGAQSDIGLAIELKKLELEQTRLLFQLQEDSKRRDKEWEFERIKWKAEFDFKREEVLRENDTRGKAGDALTDLAAALVMGIDAKRGARVASNPAPSPAAPSQAVPPQEQFDVSMLSFPCQSCEEKITIKPGEPSVVCDQCGTEYQVQRRGNAVSG